LLSRFAQTPIWYAGFSVFGVHVNVLSRDQPRAGPARPASPPRPVRVARVHTAAARRCVIRPTMPRRAAMPVPPTL
jgi:hypothetical protein